MNEFSHVDIFEIHAVSRRGPEIHRSTCYIDPRSPGFASNTIEAMRRTAIDLKDGFARLNANLPMPETHDEGDYVSTIENPQCLIGRDLDEQEMADMRSCLITYGARDREFKVSADRQQYGFLSILQTGRKLAFLRRVIHVNPESWDFPPLFIPTSFGINCMYKQRNEVPSDWVFRIDARLHGREREALNEARHALNLPTWETSVKI